ncbi:MAG: phosphoenolpyruvate--protein phosphotransferase, partial [Oscillospiraceae bacterium]|nr:phosphoenolpyruvate--protein phosphotransferase [Oscillospiraceae bacterium]
VAYLDGETGSVVLDPDELTHAQIREKYNKQQEMKEILATMKGQEDVTLDGKKMLLYCNIGSPEDVSAVLANDGQGIGLFRSEFLYLSASDYPSEDEQFEAYRAVAAAMNGKRVVIRTLDIGADKQVDYFGMKKEENPALGVRAIRICLNRPEVFRTQLRALYRASVFGKIAIMFPMITSVWEVKECKRACQSVMKELETEGIPYNPDTELGIMIETPSSVFVAEELAKLVDFFSVGTNDLTQYTLACDRQANDLGKFYDPHHPALLRAIKMAADAAHKAGIWIGICGELGADISMLPTFLAIGIDELSVSPAAVLPVRAAIRQSIAQTCTLEMLEC